jgi:pyrroline-5-carboxylate reductase
MAAALAESRITFVGSGNMAEGMIRALVAAGQVSPTRIVASDARPERAEELAGLLGVTTTTENVEAAAGADIVVLSVKPQVLPGVLDELSGRLKDSALVISIVAGVPVGAISSGLDHAAIVRTMPNTPAQVGAAMTVWIASPAVTKAQQAQTRELLSSMGQEIQVEDEDALDMATAVSGSGPAYVFLVMEALVDAAVHLGFKREQARILVIQTVLGSALFAQKSGLSLAALRKMVTSPGGTTAEGIYEMEKGGVRTALSKAVWAAYRKSRALGEEAGGSGRVEE